MVSKTPEEAVALKELIEQAPLRTLADYTFGSRGRIGRNAPCPCGSGMKFKKCCLHNPLMIRVAG